MFPPSRRQSGVYSSLAHDRVVESRSHHWHLGTRNFGQVGNDTLVDPVFSGRASTNQRTSSPRASKIVKLYDCSAVRRSTLASSAKQRIVGQNGEGMRVLSSPRW